MRRQNGIRLAVATTAVALSVTACGNGTPKSVQNLGSTGKAATGNVLAKARESGVLRVSNTQANPPYSMVDGNNQVVGFDVDVARELARRMGIAKVTFIPGTFQTFIPGLQADKWDAVIAGLTITEERKKQVDFSCPYQVNAVSIFAKQGTGGVSALSDLVGKRIAVSAGSSQEQEARGIKDAKVLSYDNSTLALSDVASGRADAYIGSRFTGAYFAQKNKLAVAPVGADLSSETNGMAFAKGQTELVAAANKALSAMIADGTLARISTKWLGGLDVTKDLPKGQQC